VSGNYLNGWLNPEVAMDKTAVAPIRPGVQGWLAGENVPHETTDNRPWYIKAFGKLPMPEKAKERFNIIPYAKQQKYNEETFEKTHGDVFRERFGESHPAHERLMQMGDSLDEEHNLPFGTPIMGIFPTPTGLYNKNHKEGLRNTFDKMGIERRY